MIQRQTERERERNKEIREKKLCTLCEYVCVCVSMYILMMSTRSIIHHQSLINFLYSLSYIYPKCKLISIDTTFMFLSLSLLHSFNFSSADFGNSFHSSRRITVSATFAVAVYYKLQYNTDICSVCMCTQSQQSMLAQILYNSWSCLNKILHT